MGEAGQGYGHAGEYVPGEGVLVGALAPARAIGVSAPEDLAHPHVHEDEHGELAGERPQRPQPVDRHQHARGGQEARHGDERDERDAPGAQIRHVGPQVVEPGDALRVNHLSPLADSRKGQSS